MWLRSRRSATAGRRSSSPKTGCSSTGTIVSPPRSNWGSTASQQWCSKVPVDAYVEAVRSNISHGMPLTLSERRRAGVQILAVHPTWSDRRIASCCGLSAKTIKRLRDESGSFEIVDRVAARGRGATGRVRPVDPGSGAAGIVAELERCPEASLRTIAASVGASPETVRSVRNQLRADRGVRAFRSTLRRMMARHGAAHQTR